MVTPEWHLLLAIAQAQRIIEGAETPSAETWRAWRALEDGLRAFEDASGRSACLVCGRYVALGEECPLGSDCLGKGE